MFSFLLLIFWKWCQDYFSIVSEFVSSQITSLTLVCILAALHTLTLGHVKELYEVCGDFYNTVLFWLFIFSIQKKCRLSCFIFFHHRRCDSKFFHYFLWCSVTWYCWCSMPLKILVTFLHLLYLLQMYCIWTQVVQLNVFHNYAETIWGPHVTMWWTTKSSLSVAQLSAAETQHSVRKQTCRHWVQFFLFCSTQYRQSRFMPGLCSWKMSHKLNTKFTFKTLYFLGVKGLTTTSYIVYDYTTGGRADL